jgi:hypothetical protein
MRFVSFLVFVNRAGRCEQAAFATQRRLAPDRSLTLATQFWTEDTLEHRLQVVDEPAAGDPRVIATRTAVASAGQGLLSVDLSLPPLLTPGTHYLHLDVDDERVMRSPIAVTVREIPRRGHRARYKGRGTLTALRDGPTATAGASDDWKGWPRAAFSSPVAFVRSEHAGGGYLRHGELFPMERPVPVNGTVSGLWIAAYFQGFERDDEGMHLFSVKDLQAQGENVLAVSYAEVVGSRHSLSLSLDPIDAGRAHTLGLAIDGRDVGVISVSI